MDTTKPINTFGGGVITTNSKKLMQSIRNKIEKLPDISKQDLMAKIKLAYWEGFLTSPIIFRLFVWPALLLANLVGIDFVRKYKKSRANDSKRVFKLSNMQAKMGIRQLEALDKNNNKGMFKASLLIKEMGKKKKKIKKKKKKKKKI